jgi:AmmeMemoRadiSam system protein A
MDFEETRLPLTAAQKRDLLQLARQAIAAYIAGLPLPSTDLLKLDQVHAGVFVSLHSGEQLRGCIGYVEGARPLPEAVRETAISAASRDPRFEPLAAEELAQVEIEISVLSTLRKIASPAEIILGQHGVMVRLGHHQGLLLPQVSLHHEWDVEAFLTHVCQKAGLSAEAWKDPDADIFVFEAEVFSETGFASDSAICQSF